MSREDFEQVVEEALGQLPERFSALLENIAVVVEDEDEDEEESELLGIYRGVPLTERSHEMMPLLPDQIAIFRGPILRIAHNRREAVREIRDTVVHELGHYFGLDDDEMVF